MEPIPTTYPSEASTGAKHIIWDFIILEATKLRPYLDYILDKERVLQAAKQSVTIVKEKLNKKPVDYA